MSQNNIGLLIKMANSIAENLRHDGISDQAVAEKIADHIRKFWTRSMKSEISSYVNNGGSDLNRDVCNAIKFLD